MAKPILVIGDTHAPAMHRNYLSFLKKTYDEWDCGKVLHIGDLVDWGAISFHEKHPSASSAKEEYLQAKKQVSKLYEAFPKVDWLLGNHDSLTVRQASSVGIFEELLKDQRDVWEVPGWTVHPRFAVIEIGGVLFSHGETGKGGMFAAVKQSRDNFQPTVTGHFHAEAGIWYSANDTSVVWGLNVGTGIDRDRLAFFYGQKFPRKPILSCGVVVDSSLAHLIPMPMRK